LFVAFNVVVGLFLKLLCDTYINNVMFTLCLQCLCLQCFDTIGWVAGRASGQQKTWVVGCWCGYLSGARCRYAYGPDDATAIHSVLLQLIHIGFTFLVYVSGTDSPR